MFSVVVQQIWTQVKSDCIIVIGAICLTSENTRLVVVAAEQ